MKKRISIMLIISIILSIMFVPTYTTASVKKPKISRSSIDFTDFNLGFIYVKGVSANKIKKITAISTNQELVDTSIERKKTIQIIRLDGYGNANIRITVVLKKAINGKTKYRFRVNVNVIESVSAETPTPRVSFVPYYTASPTPTQRPWISMPPVTYSAVTITPSPTPLMTLPTMPVIPSASPTPIITPTPAFTQMPTSTPSNKLEQENIRHETKLKSLEDDYKRIRKELVEAMVRADWGYDDDGSEDYGYGYNDSRINELTQEIATLQKRLVALRGDTSEEGRARRRRIENELDEKQAELSRLENSHSYSSSGGSNYQEQIKMLDSEYESAVDEENKLHQTNIERISQGLDPIIPEN